ncbi:MAG: RNA methyltransferase [Clostridia bacterium]|nr:RNA methyltransferase [Clostridia bacterium]
MEVKHISSAENEYIKTLVKLKDRKYRERFGLFIVEGERSARDAVSSGFPVDSVVMTESYFERRDNVFSEQNIITVPDKLFKALCDTKTPQGVLAVAKLPEGNREISGKTYICCDCIQDPGNAGTIIRSADAFGFDGVIFMKGSVDVFSPKVIRSSMGSVFHIPVITDVDAKWLNAKKQEGYFLSVTALHRDSVALRCGTFTDQQIFVIGNEGNGVSDAVLSMADETVHIPMQGSAESLNAGVAASVLMYEVSCHG